MRKIYIILLLTELFFVKTYCQQVQTSGTYFKEGFELYTAGQYDLAIKNYNLAIGLEPQKAYFYFHRANAFMASNHKDLALKDYEKSNNLKPTPETYYQIGVLNYDKKDSIAALYNFEQARNLRDNFDKLNYYLGILYYKINRYDSSLSCFTKYTAVVKTNGDAYYYLAACKVKQTNYAEAALYLNKSLMYSSNDFRVYYKLYEVYLLMGEKEKALYNISMAIELGINKASYYNFRAELYASLGFKEKAKEDLELASSATIK